MTIRLMMSLLMATKDKTDQLDTSTTSSAKLLLGKGEKTETMTKKMKASPLRQGVFTKQPTCFIPG